MGPFTGITLGMHQVFYGDILGIGFAKLGVLCLGGPTDQIIFLGGGIYGNYGGFSSLAGVAVHACQRASVFLKVIQGLYCPLLLANVELYSCQPNPALS